jgi:hypothetical protein
VSGNALWDVVNRREYLVVELVADSGVRGRSAVLDDEMEAAAARALTRPHRKHAVSDLMRAWWRRGEGDE